MAVSRPRSRIVSFRVSLEAFDRLSVLRESDDGPRSLSKLTRLAVEALLKPDQGSAQPNVHQMLYRVDQAVSEVEKKVDRLIELLAPGDPAPETAASNNRNGQAAAPLTRAAAAGGKLLAAMGALVLTVSAAVAQQAPGPSAPPLPSAAVPSADDTDRLRRNYVLGRNDEVMVRAPESEELNGKAFRVDADGNIHVPLLGAVRAARGPRYASSSRKSPGGSPPSIDRRRSG